MGAITSFLRNGVVIGIVLAVTMGVLWLIYYSFPLALFIAAPVALLLADSVRARFRPHPVSQDLAALTSEQTER